MGNSLNIKTVELSNRSMACDLNRLGRVSSVVTYCEGSATRIRSALMICSTSDEM